MSELKPCPFCGSNITRWQDHKEDCYFILWVEDSISLNVPRELLDKAWNTRAERTCENEYRNGTTTFKCSKCDCSVDSNDYYYSDVNIQYGDFNYCPNCGAKVIGSSKYEQGASSEKVVE